VGVVGFGMTLLGVELGRKIGTIWGRRCELIGGIVLIFMGLYFLWPVVRTLRF
jgi:putative Mn2+ efflux pump MntP